MTAAYFPSRLIIADITTLLSGHYLFIDTSMPAGKHVLPAMPRWAVEGLSVASFPLFAIGHAHLGSGRY